VPALPPVAPVPFPPEGGLGLGGGSRGQRRRAVGIHQQQAHHHVLLGALGNLDAPLRAELLQFRAFQSQQLHLALLARRRCWARLRIRLEWQFLSSRSVLLSTSRSSGSGSGGKSEVGGRKTMPGSTSASIFQMQLQDPAIHRRLDLYVG
jgi:hypothetical protein